MCMTSREWLAECVAGAFGFSDVTSVGGHRGPSLLSCSSRTGGNWGLSCRVIVLQKCLVGMGVPDKNPSTFQLVSRVGSFLFLRGPEILPEWMVDRTFGLTYADVSGKVGTYNWSVDAKEWCRGMACRTALIVRSWGSADVSSKWP
ncbi:hypothetical protein BHM03_00054158 [Ensete ventricosum]|nr:hypothetical protein BHM03_00054158 [Ensete ventricosum]